MAKKKPVRIKVRKGTLRKYGYQLDDLQKNRRKSLDKAVRSDGALPVFRKLNVLAIFRKGRKGKKIAEARRKILKDRNYVGKKYL